jgi:hypothetical protein
MKYAAMLILTLGLVTGLHAQTYKIDINDTNTPVTEAGWTGLGATHTGDGGSVTVGGVNFYISSSDGSRLRGSVGSPNPDALYGDFAYDDGAGSVAVILNFGGAKGLAVGAWEAKMHIWDQSFPTMGNMIVAYRKNGATTVVSSSVVPTAAGPAITFQLDSDGLSAYDVFVRENNGANRSRLNAVELIPLWQPVACSYSQTVLSQNPLEFYRMTNPFGEKGDAMAANGNAIGSAAPAPSLTSTGTTVFAGFGPSNTWANMASDGSSLSDLKTGWSSDEGSISYWIRLDGDGHSTETCLFARQTGGAGVLGGAFPNAIATWARNNGSYGVTFAGGAANQLDSGAAMMTMNEWHHFAVTWKRNTGVADGVLRIYLDGVEENGLTNRTWSSFMLDEVRFGKEITGDTRRFKGSVDELAIWTRELTQQEIQKQYWNGLKAFAEVPYSEGFQGYQANSGGGGRTLSGQNGWSGNGGVRYDLQTWTRMGGEWAYMSGDGQARVYIGSFAGLGGTVTMDFCGRAAGKKALFSLGYDNGLSYTPFVYFGVDGSNVRVMPYDGGGASHNTTAGFSSSDSALMRMRLEVDVTAGTGSFSYYDRTAWQFPAALQDLDLYMHTPRTSSAPQRWNAIAINGNTGGVWDNLHIVYEPPLGTTFVFR